MIQLTLTEQEVQLIIAALAKQPYEIVAQVITKVHTQATKPSDEKV